MTSDLDRNAGQTRGSGPTGPFNGGGAAVTLCPADGGRVSGRGRTSQPLDDVTAGEAGSAGGGGGSVRSERMTHQRAPVFLRTFLHNRNKHPSDAAHARFCVTRDSGATEKNKGRTETSKTLPTRKGGGWVRVTPEHEQSNTQRDAHTHQ